MRRTPARLPMICIVATITFSTALTFKSFIKPIASRAIENIEYQCFTVYTSTTTAMIRRKMASATLNGEVLPHSLQVLSHCSEYPALHAPQRTLDRRYPVLQPVVLSLMTLPPGQAEAALHSNTATRPSLCSTMPQPAAISSVWPRQPSRQA